MASAGTGLEYSFLTSWVDWEEIDTGDLQFLDVKLNEATIALVGNEIAEATEAVYICNSQSFAAFYDKDGEEILRKSVKLVFA